MDIPCYDVKNIFIVILVILLPFIVNNAFADTSSVSITPGAGTGTNANCVAQNNCFQPNNLNIVQGSTVVWTNGDSVSHYISSGNPSDAQPGIFFESGSSISPGATFSHTFNDVGTFNYFCIIHPWLTGVVTVQGGNNQQSVSNQATSNVQTVSVLVDKNSYNYGDTVTISGFVTPVIQNQIVNLQIINPDGSTRSGTIQIYPSNDGSYSYSLSTSASTAVAGTYTVSATYGNARNQVSFTYNGPIQTIKPQPLVDTDNGGLRYKMIFVYSLGQCTDFQRQAVNFYQSVTDQYLQKYGFTPSPQTWCVSKNDLTTALSSGGNYAITIIIPDILGSIPYTVNSNILGEYVYSGNFRAIVSTAYSITPEGDLAAWTLSHELSHFILNYKGYPSSIYADWVHMIQKQKDNCQSNDYSLATCQYLWTTIQAPSGRAIPVMKIYDGPAPAISNNNPTSTTPPPPSPTCPSGYYYHVSNNLCYQLVSPSLTVGTPNVNGLGVTITGQSQAITFDSSMNKISWDWGDGQTEIGWFPQSHIYSQAGTYNVKITAYDNLGNWRSVTETITVRQPIPTCPSGYYYQASDNLCHPQVQPSLNQQANSNVINNNPFNSLTATMSPTDDVLDISGYISPQFYNRGNQIEILINDQNGNQKFDQTFLTIQQVSQNIDIKSWTDGTYDMKVKYGAYESPDVFFVKSEPESQNNSTPVNVNHSGISPEPGQVVNTEISLKYNITNGKVLGIKADPQSKSLIVSTQTNGDGSLTITLPRSTINAISPTGQDDKFYVLADGQESNYQETDTTTSDRTLSIPFTDGTEEIEIIGTQLEVNNPTTQSTLSSNSIQQDGNKPQFTITTDKKSYSQGDVITISGISQSSQKNDFVSIHITNPQGDSSQTNIIVDENHEYSLQKTIINDLWKYSGTYTVEAYDKSRGSVSTTVQLTVTSQESYPISGYIAKDSDQYTIPSVSGEKLSIKIHGHLDHVSNGQVKIAWLGENKPESSTFADVSLNGDFTSIISFDSSSSPGRYQVTAYYGTGAESDAQNSIVDETSFTLVSSNLQDNNKGKTCFLFWCW